MDLKEEIKQRLDIVDVIGRYLPLKKSGNNYKSVCPFHSEKSPSFSVSRTLQIYNCFGCGKKGDLFSFIMEKEDLDFKEVLLKFATELNLDVGKYRMGYPQNFKQKQDVYKVNDYVKQVYNYVLLKSKSGETALKYLKNRKIN